MDRASDSGSEGWGFESLPVYQTVQIRTFYQLVKGSDLLFSFERTIAAEQHSNITQKFSLPFLVNGGEDYLFIEKHTASCCGNVFLVI